MAAFDDRLNSAIATAAAGDWEDLRQLADECERDEWRDARGDAAVRHDVSNLLSIGRANMEAMIDGVVPTTPDRLDRVRDVFVTAANLIARLKEAPDLGKS